MSKTVGRIFGGISLGFLAFWIIDVMFFHFRYTRSVWSWGTFGLFTVVQLWFVPSGNEDERARRRRKTIAAALLAGLVAAVAVGYYIA